MTETFRIPDGSAVTVEAVGEVALITLARPQKMNALSLALEQAVLDALGSETTARAKAIVFTGEGRAFSAGADTAELPDLTPARIAEYYKASGSLYDTVARSPKPTIAAINGYCLGAGFELALACDVRLAADTATFGLPEVGLGILPSSGGLTRMVRAVGPAVAKEIILCGDRFDARKALNLHLVKDIVAAGQLQERALELAVQLAGKPPLAYAWTKMAIEASAESSVAASMLIEQFAYAALNAQGQLEREQVST